jgi:hypothetical protein
VTVNAAVADELIETFTLDLSTASGAGLSKTRGFVTVTPPDQWVTSTLADFLLGTADPGAYVASTSGGEIMLEPQAGTEFTGAELPPDWTDVPLRKFIEMMMAKRKRMPRWAETVLEAGGRADLRNGSLHINGEAVITEDTFAPGRTLEFEARFTDRNQNVGFLSTVVTAPFAMFSVKADNQLYARSSIGGKVTETLIPGTWLGVKNQFRIDWNGSAATYSINGQQVAVHTLAFKNLTVGLRPGIADLFATDKALHVDWIRMTPFAASGSYTSPVFDAGVDAVWGSASWRAQVPTNTTFLLEVRIGNADGTWTAFAPVAKSGDLIGTSTTVGRYAQYRVTLGTTADRRTPTVKAIVLTFTK